MKTNISSLLTITALLAGSSVCLAQTTESTPAPKRVNFGYSQNPKTNAKKETSPAPSEAAKAQAEPVKVQPDAPVDNTTEQPSRPESIAKKTLEVVKTANRNAASPTESYKIGVGDVLFISLQNNSKASTYYTVLNDGTIDYPLAGELVAVAGLSPDDVEEMLVERIKLYENPQVSVRVRDYASHKIGVIGLVERPGDRYLQREAVPLFVIRAEAMVRPEANRAIIRRADSRTETVDITDERAEGATLIMPGDIVEFANVRTVGTSGKFFYIGGDVQTGGRKDFYEGLTLTQAILEAGGLRKESVKRVVVRRKNAEGLLVSTEYNLKQIKDGKAPDPTIALGDTIEVGN